MRALRFIRRLVFSAIVSALAFGLSGLALRPQPSWSIPFPRQTLFVDHPAIDDHAPIWVFTTHAKHTWLPGDVSAFDPHTGAHLYTARPPDDFVYQGLTILPDGRLMARAILPDPEFKPIKTYFAVYDTDAKRTLFERSFDGDWNPLNDAARVWRIEPTPAGFRLLIRRFSDSSIAHDFSYATAPGAFDRRDVALSPDGKTLVVCEWIKANRGPGFELWDVETKTLLRRVSLPKTTNDSRPTRAARPTFRSGQLEIEDLVPTDSPQLTQLVDLWTYDVPNGRYLDRWKPEPPAGTQGLHLQSKEGDDGRTIWTAWDFKGAQAAWFAVFRGKEQQLPWRRVPYEYRIESYMGIDGGVGLGVELTPVPHRSQFIAFVGQPPLKEALPEFLHPIADRFFDIQELRALRLWYDATSNSWRDLGISEKAAMRPRSDALFTLDAGPDGLTTLQRWPLPPRDLRWLAALIGLLSFAAALWLPLPWQRRPTASNAPTPPPSTPPSPLRPS